MATHTINRVMLDFSFPAKEKDNALQKVKQLFYDNALEQLTNRFDQSEEYIYIDRLEVDLGQTAPGEFAENFLKAFDRSWENYSLKNKTGPSAAKAGAISFTTDYLIYFLQKGYWSWNIQQRPGEEIISLARSLFEEQENIFYLLQQIKDENPAVSERLLQLLAEDRPLRRLFMVTFQKYHPALAQAWPAFDSDGSFIKSKNIFYYILAKELFHSPPLQSDKEIKTFLQKIIYKYFPAKEMVNDKRQDEAGQLLMLLEKSTDIAELRRMFSAIQKLFEQEKNNLLPATAGISPQPGSKTIYREDGEDERIQVFNAGLVLFHPYLKYVFKELNWVNDDHQFVNIKAQQKAILFLQFLIDGKSRHPEHVLVLNKILCGWPVEMPLKTSCNFSKKEKEAAGELVDALIEHWSSLKNTSRLGLIRSFAERKGLVQKTNDGFLLQVEKNAIDILLENLPFGIQTIKLPWNEYFIYTEWTY